MTNTTFRAELIATLIQANCAKYFDGTRTRAEWEAEQGRLWRKAERSKSICARVRELVAPRRAVGR